MHRSKKFDEVKKEEFMDYLNARIGKDNLEEKVYTCHKTDHPEAGPEVKVYIRDEIVIAKTWTDKVSKEIFYLTLKEKTQ